MHVFYTSPWVPAEWIRAHGVEARGAWFEEDFAACSWPLAAGTCAFAEAVVRLGEGRPDAAMVFTSHCDQLRRGCDVAMMSVPDRVFLFNLPATCQIAVAERIFASELDRLSKFLQRLGGHAPSVSVLEQAMRQHRDARASLLQAAPQCPGKRYAELVARFHWEGSVGVAAGELAKTTDGGLQGPRSWSDPKPGYARLALVGGPVPRSQWSLFDAIDRAGGNVVLNATEAGERSLWTSAPDSSPVDSLDELRRMLTHDYLANCVDVFQRPNTRLYAWLKARFVARRVQGIILWHYVGCDLWRAESRSLKEAFGLPLISLDADEAAGDNLRNLGRIEAFVEALT